MKVLEALLCEHYKLSLQQKNSQTASKEYKALMTSSSPYASSSPSPSASPRLFQSNNSNRNDHGGESHISSERSISAEHRRGNNRDWLAFNNNSVSASASSSSSPHPAIHSKTLDLANSYPQSGGGVGSGGMLGGRSNSTDGHGNHISNTSRSYSQHQFTYPSHISGHGPGPAPSYTVPRQANPRNLNTSMGSGSGSVSDRGAYNVRNSMHRMNTYVRHTRSSLLKASHQQTLYRDPKDREGHLWAPNGTGSLSRDTGSISRSRIRARDIPSLEETLCTSMRAQTPGAATECEPDRIWGPFPPPNSSQRNRLERR